MKLKKVGKILLMVLFPIGMIYCIGKNLFGSSFLSFLGGVLLFVFGFVLSIFMFRQDIIQNIFSFFSVKHLTNDKNYGMC